MFANAEYDEDDRLSGGAVSTIAQIVLAPVTLPYTAVAAVTAISKGEDPIAAAKQVQENIVDRPGRTAGNLVREAPKIATAAVVGGAVTGNPLGAVAGALLATTATIQKTEASKLSIGAQVSRGIGQGLIGGGLVAGAQAVAAGVAMQSATAAGSALTAEGVTSTAGVLTPGAFGPGLPALSTAQSISAGLTAAYQSAVAASPLLSAVASVGGSIGTGTLLAAGLVKNILMPPTLPSGGEQQVVVLPYAGGSYYDPALYQSAAYRTGSQPNPYMTQAAGQYLNAVPTSVVDNSTAANGTEMLPSMTGTGLSSNTLQYMMIAAVVVGGIHLLTTKKKRR